MDDFEEILAPQGEYRLADVTLSRVSDVVRFEARLLGPEGADVWARAWISDEGGTLAETVAPKATAGDLVTIEVPLAQSSAGCSALTRIESRPLETEQVLLFRLS